MQQAALVESIDSIGGQESISVFGYRYIKDNPPSWQPYSGTENREEILKEWKYAYNLITISIIDQEGKKSLQGGWPKKLDPFTQLDLLENEEEKIVNLIFLIRRSHSILYREKLTNRLFTLFKDAKEDHPDCPGIAANSLINFIKLLQLHPNLKYPSISLTPDNNIYASWREKQNRIYRVFSVHLLPNEDARFVIFKPNYKHPNQQIRISGTTTTDILIETVLPYGVDDWILE